MSQSIVVVGGGFAGLWAALGAARRLDELGLGADRVEVTLVNRDAWHCIRVRNYEADISDARLPLAELLEPAGVRLVIGEVKSIDLEARRLSIAHAANASSLGYDQLILAAGSHLHRPGVPGIAAHAFSIDTWDEASALQAHMRALPSRPKSVGRDTVVIVGGGLTGIEVACEMPDRLAALGLTDGHVILADRHPVIGSDMSADARCALVEALGKLGVVTRGGVSVAAIDAGGVVLDSGERVEADTVVWTAGMRASPLAALLPAALDPLGRLPVDRFMRVIGHDGVLAAGDIAAAPLAGGHRTVMSCQFGRPMGRFAGYNAVADLLGQEPLAMEIDRYVTCLDLGPWGAVLTEGWDRRLAVSGAEAKRIKTEINCARIYPPRTGSRRDLLEAAAPVIQAPPKQS